MVIFPARFPLYLIGLTMVLAGVSTARALLQQAAVLTQLFTLPADLAVNDFSDIAVVLQCAVVLRYYFHFSIANRIVHIDLTTRSVTAFHVRSFLNGADFLTVSQARSFLA